MTAPTTPNNLRALQAVAAKLRLIGPGGGYLTRPKGVYIACGTFDGDDLPAIAVFEGEETVGDQKGYVFPITLAVTVEGHVDGGDDAGLELARIKADIKRALFAEQKDYLEDDEGRFGAISYTGATVVPRVDGAQSEHVVVSITVSYPEAKGNPYAPNPS